MLTETPKIILRGIPHGSFIDRLKDKGVSELFIMEGRPRSERLKPFCSKLLKNKITPTVITDNMAGFLYFKNLVKEAWVTYQSIVSDEAVCEVGAMIVGVLSKKHGVALRLFPSDSKLPAHGTPDDILKFQGKRVAPKDIKVYVPLIERIPKSYAAEIF